MAQQTKADETVRTEFHHLAVTREDEDGDYTIRGNTTSGKVEEITADMLRVGGAMAATDGLELMPDVHDGDVVVVEKRAPDAPLARITVEAEDEA